MASRIARGVLLVCAAAVSAIAAAVDFDWTAIEPSSNLHYHPCYDGFKCARLQVPMDWNDPDKNASVAIAIITLSATVAEDDPSFGGTIIISPGGPGSSGVEFGLGFGPKFQGIADRDKHYEILAFDPRGIKYTTPAVECFDTFLGRDAMILNQQGIGSLAGGEDAIRRRYTLDQAYGEVCKETNGDTGILAHVSTAAVARDMLEIVDRVDELRHKSQCNGTISDKDRPLPRLQSLAVSYGSILGNTFASMYPGRVGRMILDAVADPADYMKGWWLSNLLDTEKVVQLFYDSCFEAGEECALKTNNDQSSADIKNRVEAFIENATRNPIPVVLHGHVFIVTGYEIRQTFSVPVIAPSDSYRAQAQLLAEAMAGNFTGLVASVYGSVSLGQDCAAEAGNSTSETAVILQQQDAQAAISCSDATDATGHGVDFYSKYVDELTDQSVTLGPTWANMRLTCSGWKVPAKWRFTGPWTTPPADPDLRDGAPAAPLLLLGSHLDPLTPILNARNVEAAHPGSVLVVQDSAGHSALGSGWSECTNNIIKDYLEFGKMPEKGAECHTDCRPWHEEGCAPPASGK